MFFLAGVGALEVLILSILSGIETPKLLLVATVLGYFFFSSMLVTGGQDDLPGESRTLLGISSSLIVSVLLPVLLPD